MPTTSVLAPAEVTRRDGNGPTPRLGLRLLAALAGLAALGAASLLVVIGVGTREQDRAAAAASTRLAATAVESRKASMGRILRDYAIWTEAYRRLYPVVDFEWAYDAGNFGANINEALGYEYVFIVDAAGRTPYAVERGEIAERDALALVTHGLDRLIAQARASGGKSGEAATGIVMIEGTPAFAAAGVVFPHDDSMPDASTDTAPVLVFLNLLDAEALGRMAESYLLRALRFAPERPDTDMAALPLTGADGEPLGWLSWRPERPGSTLLRAALPWLTAAAVTMLLAVAVVGRSLRRATASVTASMAALAASEGRFRDVATSASDWIFEADGDLCLTYLSGRFTELTGLPVAAVLGQKLTDVVEADRQSASAWGRLADAPTGAPLRGLQATIRDAAGHRRTLRLTCRAVFGAGGEVACFRGTASDVTEEIEAKIRAEFLSLHDPLTGLPNRLLFARRLGDAVASARRVGRPSAALYLDLDKFKDVNDTLGHPAGDRLLCEVTARLRGLAREADTVARLGGDEFAVLLTGCGHATEAEAFCRRALAAIAQPFELEGQTVHIGASLGIAFLPADANDADLAMRCADLALYKAKSEGRGTFRFYAPEMNLALQRRRRLEQDLRRALAAGEFELHFQPKHRTDTLALTGVEALLRWRHPERGLVIPGEFIDVAEQSGLIVPLGEWILEEACAHAARWPGISVAVNLSPGQFKSARLSGAVRRALELAGLDPGRLELEVTETLLVHDLEDARDVLLQLKALGVKLALDDFGTGYSSLAYLHSLPFDRIKIDRSFVARLGVAPDAEAIVLAVVTLGQGLGMATTAEGVEDRRQLDFLRAAGCSEVQGFLLGRPVPAAGFDAVARTTGDERRPACPFMSDTSLIVPDAEAA